MVTMPDGVPSVTNMYFWQPFAGSFYAPCVDGDYDMGVIGHEYGHMIENRMLGKGSNRVGHHAGAMGESFGDMNGMEYQNENGFVPTSDENRYAVGTYDTGNKQRAIRNYGMNYPTSGDEPDGREAAVRQRAELQRHGLRHLRPDSDLVAAGACERRDLEQDQLRDPDAAGGQVRRRLPRRRRRSSGVVCGRRAAAAELSGEPALVPALLRRHAARTGGRVDAPAS